MSDTSLWPWVGLLLLGAWHGINPGMGWLFAVAVLLAGLVGLVIPPTYLKWLVAAVLLGFGLWRLVRSRHPRFGGMQVGTRDLTIWSFLMASAHGAGLMALPFVLGLGATHPEGMHAHGGHLETASLLPMALGDQSAALLGTLLHTGGYFLVMGLVAVIVYERLGLKLLRTMWFNVDLVWAVALIMTAVLTPFI